MNMCVSVRVVCIVWSAMRMVFSSALRMCELGRTCEWGGVV